MNDENRPRVAALYRYPVKGLSAEPLDEVAVEAGETLPFDRAFAIENGPGEFDERAPKHVYKAAFVMLMRHERLALLDTRFDGKTSTLTISQGGKVAAEGQLDDARGRAAIEKFIAEFMGEALAGRPRVVRAPGHSFTDAPEKCVSIINLASVRAIEQAAGMPVEPIRFRGNIYVEGLPAWAEFDLVERPFSIGGVELFGLRRTKRCAATTVNPLTAERDVQVPRIIMEAFGHADCGIYASVKSAGRLAVGMELEVDEVRR